MTAPRLWSEVLPSMLAGTWTPPRGSILFSLLRTHRPGPSDLALCRAFARHMLDSEGIWWVEALNRPQKALVEDDRVWVVGSWHQWITPLQEAA